MSNKKRKESETSPPGQFMRTHNGKPCELVKTTKLSPAGTWYYRLWYGTVIGNQHWTLDELKQNAKQWYKRCPKDLVEKEKVT